MLGADKERWQELCGQAAVEQDPKRLLQLITEINRLLEAKEKRLLEACSSEAKSDSAQQPENEIGPDAGNRQAQSQAKNKHLTG